LKVAVDATVRFIAEQSVQAVLRFSHKTPNQPDVDQLKLPNFYREKQTIDRVHNQPQHTAALCQPSAG